MNIIINKKKTYPVDKERGSNSKTSRKRLDRETKAKGRNQSARERGGQKRARQRGVRFARRETAGKISQGTVSPAVKIRVQRRVDERSFTSQSYCTKREHRERERERRGDGGELRGLAAGAPERFGSRNLTPFERKTHGYVYNEIFPWRGSF